MGGETRQVSWLARTDSSLGKRRGKVHSADVGVRQTLLIKMFPLKAQGRGTNSRSRLGQANLACVRPLIVSFGELNSFANLHQGQLCVADSSIKEILLRIWIKKKAISTARSTSLCVKASRSASRAALSCRAG